MKILNGTWKVKEVNAHDLANVMKDDSVYYLGGCQYVTKTIYILQGLSKEQYRETLVHELTHALLYETSIKQHLTNEQQEQYCEFMKFAHPIIDKILKSEINDN